MRKWIHQPEKLSNANYFDIKYTPVLNNTLLATKSKKTSTVSYTLFTADIISTVEFNHSGELLATGDKGGRVVIFQQEPEVSFCDLSD